MANVAGPKSPAAAAEIFIILTSRQQGSCAAAAAAVIFHIGAGINIAAPADHVHSLAALSICDH